MSGLVERICHREQLSIWAGELTSALALGDFLKEDWSFDDSVDLERELVAQLRDIMGSALTHPEVNVTELLSEMLEALVLLEREMVLSGNAGSTDYGWTPAIQKTRAAIAKATQPSAALSNS